MTTRNEPWSRSGSGIINGRRVTFTGMAAETSRHCYEALRLDDGTISYTVDYQEVDRLPNTSITRRLLEQFRNQAQPS